ncbi:MAG: hypothetical protein WD396_06585, partial [Pseudohongiellaceae bacterium]
LDDPILYPIGLIEDTLSRLIPGALDDPILYPIGLIEDTLSRMIPGAFSLSFDNRIHTGHHLPLCRGQQGQHERRQRQGFCDFTRTGQK